jgi:hypothetical protein
MAWLKMRRPYITISQKAKSDNQLWLENIAAAMAWLSMIHRILIVLMVAAYSAENDININGSAASMTIGSSM